MYKVSEVESLDIPVAGLSVSLKGKFYYRIAENGKEKSDFVNCYIADSSDSDSPRLYLSNGVGEAVIDEDEIFGMMVGGEYAYFGLDAEITGLVKKTIEGLICESVKLLKLEKDGESQEFSF